MRILVANPPAYFKEFPNRHFIQAGSRWSFSFDAPKESHKKPHYQPYPFSLGYAVSLLRERGEEVDAFDGCALDMDEEEWLRRVEESSPDWLIAEVPTVSFSLMEKLLTRVEERVEGLKITVTGPHATAMPGDTRFHVIPQEWEDSLTPSAFIDYPFPDREFFPNELYSNFEFHRPSAQMISSRGCSQSCIYCLERHVVYGNNAVRTRRAVDAVDEMAYMKELGARQIWFDDMSITASEDHVKRVCGEMLSRGLDMPWAAMGDMDASEETVKLMAEAGCLGLMFGVETINPMALWAIGKRFVTKEKAVGFAKTLRKHGIHGAATFSIGLPSETRETILETIEFATEELGADSIQFSIAVPFPGTPFFRMCEKSSWLVTNRGWTYYDGARYSVVDYPHLSHEQIEGLYNYAMEERKRLNLGFRR